MTKSECHASDSTITHTSTGRCFKYGELVETAAQLPLGNLEDAPLKNASNFRLLGKDSARVDTPEKVNGSAIFGLDVRVPGMLFAVVARCPHFGGKLATCDDSAAKTVPGVKAIFPVAPIGYLPGIERKLKTEGGVAVVATSTWAALEARKALKLTWDKAASTPESTATLQQLLHEKASGPPSVVAVNCGDASHAFAGASQKIEASYELPFQAHATMEPMNTTVHVRSDGQIEVWSPTQIANIAQAEIAQLASIPTENVIVHMTLSGGSFGRRYQWDYVAEAYQVAHEMEVPVQVMWTREDDLQHDFYRQYSLHHMLGALDGTGNILAWSHRVVSTPIRSVFDSEESLKDPKHVASQEIGFSDALPYQTPNYRLDYAPVDSLVPRAWWRAVSASMNAFAIECFVDELAHGARRDPFEFRMNLLRTDQSLATKKLRTVLQLAAEKSQWNKPLPAGHGRGIASYIFSGSYVAEVAEVSVEKDGMLRVHRVVAAIDCGFPVNPDSVRAQIEGCINYALTPVLCGEITIKDGAVEQSNFHDYRVLCLKDAPEIEVHIVPSTEDPATGVGEGGVPPLAPAVANAVFAATGKRLRRLPVSKIN